MKVNTLLLISLILLAISSTDLDQWGEPMIEPERLKVMENYEKGIKLEPKPPTLVPEFIPPAIPNFQQGDPLKDIPNMAEFNKPEAIGLADILTKIPEGAFGSSFNLVGNDESEDEHEEINPLENDYKDILETFKQIGCFPKRDKTVKMEEHAHDSLFGVRFAQSNLTNPYSLCDEDVADELLAPLGFQNGTKTSIYNHFRNKIYRPLGFKTSPYRHSYADVLHDLLYLDDSDQTIHKTLPLPTTQDFIKIIMGSFAEISNYSADFDNNKDIISRIIMDILKQFHIFWNIARQKKLISNTKINTYSVLKQIISKYRETNNAMRATTLTILDNVKDAYFRFVKASKLHEMIKDKPGNIVVYQLLKRYDENIRRIRANKSDEYTEIYELSVFLDLLRALFIINYYGKKDSLQSREFFKTEIVEKIKRIYKAYKNFMTINNDPALNPIKDFTATLLLKMEHRVFIIFQIYTIEGYISKPLFNYNNQFMSGIKLFYELTDNLMLVPGQCQDLLSVKLEFCARQKVFDVLTDLYNKYLLYASVSGANMYRYVFDSLNDMLSDMKSKNVFDNFIFFRNYYFAELFKFSEVYRDQYKIKDMTIINQLENAIGMKVEQYKAMGESGIEVADLLDQKLYDFFLDIKSDFNQFAPLKSNYRQLQQISYKFQTTLDKFFLDYKAKVDPHFSEMINAIKEENQKWLGSHETKYTIQIGTEDAETPATQYIPLPIRDSETIHTYVNEPQINSGLVSPVVMPSGGV